MKRKTLSKIIALPIAISGMGAIGTTISCGDPEPSLKTMFIKRENNTDMPTEMEAGQEIYIAAYDENGTRIFNVGFSATSNIKITTSGISVKITAQSDGIATIKCFATGYMEAKCDLTIKSVPKKDMVMKLDDGGEIPHELKTEQSITVAGFDGGTKITNITLSCTDPHISVSGRTITAMLETSSEITITCSSPGYKNAVFSIRIIP